MTTPRERFVDALIEALELTPIKGEGAASHDKVELVFDSFEAIVLAEYIADKALASRVPTPCETCSGTQKVGRLISNIRGTKTYMSPFVPCPDCEPPRPLVVLYDDLEQVEVVEVRTGTRGDRSKFPAVDLLYRIQHKESEAP